MFNNLLPPIPKDSTIGSCEWESGFRSGLLNFCFRFLLSAFCMLVCGRGANLRHTSQHPREALSNEAKEPGPHKALGLEPPARLDLSLAGHVHRESVSLFSETGIRYLLQHLSQAVLALF